LTSTWAWVLTLDVLGSFHLGFHRSRLYICISTAFQNDVQVAFHFPLDKLAQDPYDVATRHWLQLLSQWCFALPPCGMATWHKETRIGLKCFLVGDWENLLKEIFNGFKPR
jgi:hypothetical protein